MTASRSRWYASPANIAVCTAAMTSPASEPIIVKPEDAVVGADKDLQKALRSIGCLGAQHAAHRQMPDADRYSLGLPFTLAQLGAHQRRVGD